MFGKTTIGWCIWLWMFKYSTWILWAKNTRAGAIVIPYISIPELGKYVSKLDNKKSPGPDGISNHLLKLSLPYIIDSLTYIFNLCIEKNHYPSEFKKAKVIPLPKTRDKTNLTDYRPISLLSVLSKLLEKHVHVQLNDYLEKHLLIHPFQSGFRCKHSCSTALVRLTHSQTTGLQQGCFYV